MPIWFQVGQQERQMRSSWGWTRIQTMSKNKKNAYKDFAKMTAEFGKNWNTIKQNTKKKSELYKKLLNQ